MRVWTLPRGPWPAAMQREPGLMGFLVLDGVLTRNVSLGKIAYPELLGRGDLLRPWQQEATGLLGRLDVSWQILEPCRVAVLDRRFGGIVGRWPEIVDQLLGRALNRARELDYNMAIAQLPLLPLPEDVRLVSPVVFVSSIAISVAAMFLLTLACGWQPSRLATRIQPAEALHYE